MKAQRKVFLGTAKSSCLSMSLAESEGRATQAMRSRRTKMNPIRHNDVSLSSLSYRKVASICYGRNDNHNNCDRTTFRSNTHSCWEIRASWESTLTNLDEIGTHYHLSVLPRFEKPQQYSLNTRTPTQYHCDMTSIIAATNLQGFFSFKVSFHKL